MVDTSLTKKNVGIIAHGDADGICAAAIIKTIYPGALVMFSKASQLHKVIKEIEKRITTMDVLFIVDVAINPKAKQFVLDRLKKGKEKYEIYYYDNHILPDDIDDQHLTDYVDKYVPSYNSSSSAVAFQELYGSTKVSIKIYRFQANLASFGSIADYARECPLLQSVLDLYDESNAYYQAFMLKQASRVINDDELKRSITDKLSVGILPSEIVEVVESARAASREVDVAVDFIQQHSKKFGDIGVIMECPVASMGHNAYIAATHTNARVGVAVRRQGGMAFFVLRRRHNETIHLGKLAAKVGKRLNSDGGGEEATAGITTGDGNIENVIELIQIFMEEC